MHRIVKYLESVIFNEEEAKYKLIYNGGVYKRNGIHGEKKGF